MLVVERMCQSSLRQGPRLENEGHCDQLPEKSVVLMKYLVRFYEIMSQGDRYFLTASEGKELQDCAYKVNLLYSDLTKAAQELRLKQWGLQPKFHFFERLAWQGTFLNPRLFWTYMSEDFVGQVARMASGLRMLSGVRRCDVALKLILSYRFAWFLWMKMNHATFDH